MSRGLRTAELELEPQQRDREVTLGPMLLTMLGLGLFAVCALCFLSGYAMGRHAVPEGGQTLAEKGAPSAEQLFSQQPKPSAMQAEQQVATDAVAGQAEAGLDGAAPAAQAADTTQGVAVVPAAAPAQSAAAQPAVATQPAVHAALPQSGGALWTVQIALTPNQRDAELMANDLRTKGVTVTLRRDAASNLVYVQAGPFATHDEAAAMRQKVVAAGYNGIIQP